MSEGRPPYQFSVYRSEINAGDGGYVAEERYCTIAEVLAHPYESDQEYWIHLHGFRRWLPREKFEAWASQQKTQ